MNRNNTSNAEERKKAERRERAQKIASERFKAKKLKLEKIELYHFTDVKNIQSIMKYGLLGWMSLEKDPYNLKREIDYFPASDIPSEGSTYGLSRWLDVRGGYPDHIRLTSNKNHPMVDKAITKNYLDIKFIKISKTIIEEIGCLYSDMNATANAATINTNMATYLDSDDPQKEILVGHHIPVSYIEEIEDF